MSRMPGTNWLGEHAPSDKLMSRYDVVCVHTIVGYAPAHAAHFSTHHDGQIDQSRDTKYQSAANWYGNPRVIAIENEDHGSSYGSWNVNDGHAVPAFTDAQIEAIAQICAWAHEEHGIPLQPCPNSKPESRGIAYHRQGIDGNWSGYAYSGRVSGGELWSQHYGKVCPGDRRISQIPEIIERAQAIARGEDMAITDADAQKIAQAVHGYGLSDMKTETGGDTIDAGVILSWLDKRVVRIDENVTKLLTTPPANGGGETAAVLVSAFTDEALATMAKAVNDETARRYSI